MTLIEMLTVMAIIALMMALLVTGVAGLRKRAKERATRATIRLLSVAIERFKEDWGVYPPDRIDAVLALTGASRAIAVPAGYYSDGPDYDNEGIKALYIALTIPKKNGPYIDTGMLAVREFAPTIVAICEPFSGGNSQCDTNAIGDDAQLVAPGADAVPGQVLINPGPDGVMQTVPAPTDDDIATIPQHVYYVQHPVICEVEAIDPNSDGQCNSVAAGDDIQVVPNGDPCSEGAVLIDAGPNGLLETRPDPANQGDVAVFGEPQPIMVFLDSWGNDLRYDRGDTAGDNAAPSIPSPVLPDSFFGDGPPDFPPTGRGDSHMLRNRASFDLWSVGGNGIDDSVDPFSAICEPIAGGDATCNTSAVGDDVQVVASGVLAAPGQVVVTYGADQRLDTAAGGDDRFSAINREIWDGDDGDDVTNWELSIYVNR